MKSYSLLGVRIDDPDPARLEVLLQEWLREGRGKVIVTPNAEFLLESLHNAAFAELLNQSDLAIADSVSMAYAVAALHHDRLAYREPGVDLLGRLCQLSAETSGRVLFLGGDPGAAEQSAQNIRDRYPLLDVRAIDPGQIPWQDDSLMVADELVATINALEPDVVAVALGQHKQEQFIKQARERCPQVRIWIGVGGALEMISGQKRRAPRVFSHLGLEWIWRLIIEPSRWRRIFRAAIVFPLIVAIKTLQQGTFLASLKQVFAEIFRQFRNV